MLMMAMTITMRIVLIVRHKQTHSGWLNVLAARVPSQPGAAATEESTPPLTAPTTYLSFQVSSGGGGERSSPN